jgi:CMP-N-acetylneuraminic acid synthetase
VKVACVIPARQWSRGTPGKNRDGFANALQTAIDINTAGIIVSTDDPMLWDDPRYTLIKRPAHLEDGDSAAVIEHAVRGVQADVCVVLQPSSPTLNRADYCHAAILRLIDDPDATSVVSVVPWGGGEPPQKACFVSGGVLQIPESRRRQDCAPAYRRDGTVYAVRMTYAKAGDLYGPCPVPLLITPRDSVTVD